MLASPLSTVSYDDATAALKELHKYLSCLSTLHNNTHSKSESSAHDQFVAELMRDDYKSLDSSDKLQVFRPLTAHGIGLHYKLLRHNSDAGTGGSSRGTAASTKDLASLVLAASRANSTTTAATASVAAAANTPDADNGPRTIEKQFLGVLICVGMSGLPYGHCSSSLQYGLSQRVNDCIGLLSSKRMGCADVTAAKTILSTLLVTEDEGRKTNEVADAAYTTAIPESGEDTGLKSGGHAHKKGSAFTIGSGKRLRISTKIGKNMNFAAGLLNRTGVSGETNLHVGESSTSNELARALLDRLTVLSVAENDSFLQPYKTSGQQRKANLDLTGNKSRFRKRKTDVNTNADLDAFDYKGPALNSSSSNNQNRRPRWRQGHFPSSSSAPANVSSNTFNNNGGGGLVLSTTPSIQSTASTATTASGTNKSVASTSTAKVFRQHKSDAHTSSRRNRAVPTLSAPRGDGATSSRRGSTTSREDPAPAEDDVRSRRPAKNQGNSGRRVAVVEPQSATSNNSKLAGGDGGMEDASETSRSAQRLQVNIALNEDLTCSYKFSKMTSCSVEGVIQVQVKTNVRYIAPFHMDVRDPSQHILTLQENKKFADDTLPSTGGVPGNRSFTITVPKADNYFPLIRYKCSSELRPVPIRVQTRVKVDNGFCRVALQISSNPHNEGSLTDLTIIMGVANEIKGESLVTQPAGGVWNASKRSVIWCVSELGDGEKFQLQARFEMDLDSAAAKDDDIPKFPVLVRCQCMYAQLSDVEVSVRDLPEQSAEVAMKVARRFRLSHQERS